MNSRLFFMILVLGVTAYFCAFGFPSIKLGGDNTPINDAETVNDAVQKVLESENSSDKFVDERPVVLLFYADWCTSCRKFMPSFDIVKSRIGTNRCRFVKVNVDKQGRLADHFRIRTIPTVYIYDKKFNYTKKVNLYNFESELRQYIENRK